MVVPLGCNVHLYHRCYSAWRLYHNAQMNNYIIIGVVMGTLMAANVWMVIWPAQKIALGIEEGGDRQLQQLSFTGFTDQYFLLCSYAMGYVAGPHYAGYGYGTAVGGTGLIVALVIIAAIELNGLKGKQGPLTTVRGVIVSSLVLTAVLAIALNVL